MPLSHRNPQCVFIAASAGEANIVANWLQHQDIPAQVMDQASLGSLLRTSLFIPRQTRHRGVEVWVTNPSDFDRARQLLQEHEFGQQQRPHSDEPVLARCEECGTERKLAGRFRGSVQNCGECGAYIDVPGDDDLYDWSEAEETEPET